MMMVMTLVVVPDVTAGVAVMKPIARQQRIVGRREIVRLIHAAAGANQRKRSESYE
ncbi:MAG TPA: hypothetical protein VN903_18885 [Polyangia bacterium]|nr:hypothetical protein [Polyangia bacterium]